MSRLHPSIEFPRSAEVQSALEQLDEPVVDNQSAGSVPARYDNGASNLVAGAVAKVQRATYRCRLYRISSKGLPEGTFIYAMVRDTLENPVESKNLPNGELIFDASDSSFETVQSKASRFRQSLGKVRVADWRNFGSV